MIRIFWNFWSPEGFYMRKENIMQKDEAPEFKTPSGEVVKAPNWPKGAPQINGPRTADPSDVEEVEPSEDTNEASQK